MKLETLAAYVADMEERLREKMPSRERQAQLLAGRELGKAIDAAREVGLRADGIAESFRGVWENLIEDHSK
jgi:hypothetical protein